jgi:predicted AlkP superfamily pyrophosphatase or phosphodiesterase
MRGRETRAIAISIDGLAGFYWNDPRARMPVLRRLAERGAVCARMEAVFPSTTWPTHVSLVTGVRPVRHGVAGNHILNRRTGRAEDLTGDPIHDASVLLRAPTIYDRAHDAGLTTAAIDWPCTRNAASLDWSLPFFKDQRVFEAETPRRVWAELGALGYPMDRQGEWAQLPKRFLKDAMVADVAAHVIARHAPDLLLIHFLSTDSFQHLYGPRSPEAYWAIEYVDAQVGRLLSALPDGALDRDTTVFVVSDHGFLPSSRAIRPNVRLRQLGLLRSDERGQIEEAAARVVMNHGAAYLYVLAGENPAATARDLLPELAKLEGVSQVWTPREYAALGLPTPDDNPHAGDLVLEAAAGYSFVDDADGDALVGPPKYLGTHGQLPTHADNAAFFLAAGAGIRPAVELGPITSRDVAPTLANVLAIEMAEVEGRVLAEGLA